MKVTKKENPRVVVYPSYFSWEGEKAAQDLCESIKKDIQRHVDGVNQIDIKWDKEEVCSYCGLTWETDEAGQPQCCTKAQEEWEKKIIEEMDYE